MKLIKYTLLAFVLGVGITACNVDNADSPANTVTEADTTTNTPEAMPAVPLADPASIDTNALLADTMTVK